MQDSRIQRLLEKMKEAQKEKKDSLDAKMWGYSGFDTTAPYDLFDFRVSRHRDGPAEYLEGYTGHVMADCYSGNMSVILAPGSKMTRMNQVERLMKRVAIGRKNWRAPDVLSRTSGRLLGSGGLVGNVRRTVAV